MKKILMLLLILSSIAFASDQEGTGEKSTESAPISCIFITDEETASNKLAKQVNDSTYWEAYRAYLKCLAEPKPD